MKKKIKAGIIGLGVGEQHIEGYRKHPDCEVVALCDFSNEKLSELKAKYPELLLFTDTNELLEYPEIDVVSIASYDNYHYEQIMKAIENDKHIFVEKPLCLYEEEAAKIHAALASKPSLKMSSNLILRMSPRFRLLKEMIKKGEFGQLFYLDGDYNYGRIHKITEGWRGKIDFYSVVYGGGVHIVDLFLWLAGDRIDEVCAYGNNISTRDSQFRFNDTVVAILKFRSGIIGKLSSNFSCVFPHFHKLTIYGTKATFENGLGYGRLYESRDPSATSKKITALHPGVHKGDLIFDFIEMVLTGSSNGVSQEEVFDAMSVCFAIEKAVSKMGSVKVKYL